MIQPIPATIPPMLAGRAVQPPAGEDWIHEIKHDGFRLMCRKEGDGVRFYTRGGYDWSEKFAALRAAVSGFDASTLWMDGELVVLQPDGRSCFGGLQRALRRRDQNRLVFFAFDLLHLDGADLCCRPLIERKELLQGIIPAGIWNVKFVDHLQGHGAELFRHCCALDMEGIISKRIDSPYRPGERSTAWLKVKNQGYHLVRTGSTEGWDRKKRAA